jgi:hypothetical protein
VHEGAVVVGNEQLLDPLEHIRVARASALEIARALCHRQANLTSRIRGSKMPKRLQIKAGVLEVCTTALHRAASC